MSGSGSSASAGGIGLGGLLTILFIFLKFNPGGNFDTPIQDWSWWWVLAPIWISVIVNIVVAAFLFLILDER